MAFVTLWLLGYSQASAVLQEHIELLEVHHFHINEAGALIKPINNLLLIDESQSIDLIVLIIN